MTENKETKTQSKTQILEMQCNQTCKKLYLHSRSLTYFQIENYLCFFFNYDHFSKLEKKSFFLLK